MKKWVIGLLHLSYWIMYTLIALMVIMAMVQGKNVSGQQIFRVLLFSPLSAGAFWPAILSFYTFYFVLFSKFLKKRRIGVFLIAAFAVAIGSALLTLLLMYPFFYNLPPFNGNTDALFSLTIFFSFIGAVHGTLALILRGFVSWYGDIKVKLDLTQKNHEMELALMKAQLNPHFLFNTINNIDVLILKDPTKASHYLNKLSDMMRFMLYETKTEKISLSTELSYIEKYIELQRIRTSNPNYIFYETKGNPEGWTIEPMLFIPFIENAFKHAENKKVENAIRISLSIEKNQIRFECENAYSSEPLVKPEYSGLGNELIRRRLSLIYPNKHTLHTSASGGTFKVNLIIETA